MRTEKRNIEKQRKESIHVLIDKKTKKEVQETLEMLGLDLSSAIRIYFKKIISEKAIPFEISADPFYSESNMKFLSESIKELEEGKTKRMTIEELRNIEVDNEN